MSFQKKYLFYYFSLCMLRLSSLLFFRCLKYRSAVLKAGESSFYQNCHLSPLASGKVKQSERVINFKTCVTKRGDLLLLTISAYLLKLLPF